MNNFFLLYSKLAIISCLLLSHFISIGQGNPHAAFNADAEFLKAAEKGDVNRLKEMLKKGAHLSARNNFGVTALIWAANNGHLEAVRFLLDQGLDIEQPSNNLKTPLMWAARWGHLPVVHFLLDRGASMEFFDDDGCNALMNAAFNGHTAVVEELIERGSPITVRNRYNGTALTMTRVRGHTEVVELLEPYFPLDDSASPYAVLAHKLYGLLVTHIRSLIYHVRVLTGLEVSKHEEM